MGFVIVGCHIHVVGCCCCRCLLEGKGRTARGGGGGSLSILHMHDTTRQDVRLRLTDSGGACGIKLVFFCFFFSTHTALHPAAVVPLASNSRQTFCGHATYTYILCSDLSLLPIPFAAIRSFPSKIGHQIPMQRKVVVMSRDPTWSDRWLIYGKNEGRKARRARSNQRKALTGRRTGRGTTPQACFCFLPIPALLLR